PGPESRPHERNRTLARRCQCGDHSAARPPASPVHLPRSKAIAPRSLALAHSDFLFGSVFLLALGLVLLFGYVILAKKYFFSIPLRGVLLATFLYALALIVIWA